MDSKKRTLSLVIVGHVDHGKSTLIGRLLYDTDSVPEELVDDVKAISEELGKEMEFAYFLDALEEERQQNITIDTTQTYFSSTSRDFIIIDAPGHKEFLRNMITGVSLADAAVLMLDVEQGIEEQTQRHAYILSLLGISEVIVAANKMDAVNFSEESFSKAKEELLSFLSLLDIKPRYVIPLSARNGDNVASSSLAMPWYPGPSFVEVLENLEDPPVLLDRPLRFPLQDSFEVEGETMHVGRVESGWLYPGREYRVYPNGENVQISQIEMWTPKGNLLREKAGAGESVGVRISASNGAQLGRGSVICEGNAKAVSELKATIFWMSESCYELGRKLVFQCATQEVECEIVSIDVRINSATLEVVEESAKVLEEAEAAKVKIAFSSPVLVEDFTEIEELGRFVLVDDDVIVAGGIIHQK